MNEKKLNQEGFVFGIIFATIVFVFVDFMFAKVPGDAGDFNPGESIDVVLASATEVYTVGGFEEVKKFCRKKDSSFKAVEFEGKFFRCNVTENILRTPSKRFIGVRIRITQYQTKEDMEQGRRIYDERLEYLSCRLRAVLSPSREVSPCGPVTR